MATALNLNLVLNYGFTPALFRKPDKQLMYTQPFAKWVQNSVIGSMQLIISYFRKIFKTSELLINNQCRKLNVCFNCSAH
jgi:hypothetical protein